MAPQHYASYSFYLPLASSDSMIWSWSQYHHPFARYDYDDYELAEIETCIEETYIQFLQLSDYKRITIQQCKMEIDRTISYCGMHSYISVVQNGHRIHMQILSNIAFQGTTVIYQNQSYFLVPRSRILIKTGTKEIGTNFSQSCSRSTTFCSGGCQDWWR